MKQFLKPIAMFFCLAALAGCAKEKFDVVEDPKTVNPISDYAITPDVNDGFTYHFESLAKDFVKQEWRFGDDSLSTAEAPTHTFLGTGEYLVDLMTYSKTGNISHKYIPITIIPDSVLQLEATKTGTANQLRFNAKLKGTIKSIEWTFNLVDPTTSVITTVKSTEINPIQTFAFGSFNNFSVKVISDKGSEVSINRTVTTDGIVVDITGSYISFHSTNENTAQGPNEGSLKLVDGNTETKFGFYEAFPVQQIATLEYPAPVAVKLYAIENGNDSESTRDPKEWYVDGSNDGQNWDALDHQNLEIGFADYLSSIGQGSNRYFRFFYYPIANPKPYKFYRWRIISTFQGQFQIMEFKLFK
ncbi:MAG: PKD domain-containing protein [Bacteroidota bacterium]